MLRVLRQWIMDGLGFSRQEANGTLLLVLIILCVAILPKMYLNKSFSSSESFRVDEESLNHWAEELRVALTENERPDATPKPEETKSYTFDPNIVTKEQLIELGFERRAAQNLVSYRESGGSFAIKADLKKIYGISSERVDQLWAYISLPEKHHSTQKTEWIPVPESSSKSEPADDPVVRFSLNEASAEQLRQIRGIGPAFSDRIIKYRDRLGGFRKAEQIYEVYGLDSAVADRLLARSEIGGTVKQLSINTDSAKFLYQHPYIDYKIAFAIVNYRQQHGDYDSVEQLLGIKIISDSLFKKISPYLSIDR